ncbi:flagellar biosynthesis protein FliA [Alicyclobacillus acidoterrestris]|uniref:Flagellar biosynthesis protein FliA n=2 Tax=Alicyclobacillus acidoterrestris TaxID=1450 RepID=A0A9E7CRK6_ALIAG|nr:flagellar biosynthesis protein FliA [Alicyclobacillus acidoterrestris]
MSSILALLALVLKDVSVFVSYVKNGAFPKPLSADEERAAIADLTSGSESARESARNLLIEHNLRLVAHLVKKYEMSGEDPEDLISIGTIGLIKAVESYKQGKGTKLATYAARCIENENSLTTGCFACSIASLRNGAGLDVYYIDQLRLRRFRCWCRLCILLIRIVQ